MTDDKPYLPFNFHDSNTGCSREVSRWTLLFWIFCLAINASNQPTGRVLSLQYPHHAVLRLSPVLYMADAASVLVQWIAGAFKSGGSFRRSASCVLANRFVDADGLPNLDAIKGAKRHTRIRISSWIIGVLPQIIKLYSSGLNFFITFIGSLFFVSWVIFEIVLGFAADEKISNLRSKAIGDYREPGDRLENVRTAERYWAMLAIAATNAPSTYIFFTASNSVGLSICLTILQALGSISFMHDKTIPGMDHLLDMQHYIVPEPGYRKPYNPDRVEFGMATINALSLTLTILLWLEENQNISVGLKGILISTVIIRVGITATTQAFWGKNGNRFFHTCFPLVILIYGFSGRGTHNPDWLDYLG
ncbi:hypothetical protein F4821DRAFT_252069 [Hypoxylon rubiginosum]|uniref:Uncharacterized protein n=1 Tax=Hypoxylon rubiginosum TaxID=110542 RepID=A0ACC0CIL7_9PEZI|nr:hypothetical protein F4821DRAFT_252069 [Hypoxylon rubiginosum]